MRKFTGLEMSELIGMRTEAEAYKCWGINSWSMFLESIWLQTEWTTWFKSGAYFGAGIMIDIIDAENKETAEYQCLLHHFCIVDESKVSNATRNQ